MDQENVGVRINKYLSEAGVCSRREADRMLAEGKIQIDGMLAEPGMRVFEGQRVTVEGHTVRKEEEEIYLAFYKPVGIVCTTAEMENGERIKNVVEYINYPKRIYPIGRLDQASEGLILLTNQGEVMERILRSRYDHEKEYVVKVNRPVTEKFIREMSQGVPILDTITKPCKVWKQDEYSFRIILTQGLNRQIRRMCEVFDYRVISLCRDRVMNITLEGLRKGRYRKLTQDEIDMLKQELGLDQK